jgi:hypothetical protein
VKFLPATRLSGVKAARVWSAASTWNVGKRALIVRLVVWEGSRAVRGRAPSGRNREGLSTDATHAGGPARSSGETPVMGVERRGRLICECSHEQPDVVWEDASGQHKS